MLKERKIYTVKLFEMKKKALIIGVTGQDGTLLSNFLFKKNYKIWGTSRFIETSNFESLKTLKILNTNIFHKKCYLLILYIQSVQLYSKTRSKTNHDK